MEPTAVRRRSTQWLHDNASKKMRTVSVVVDLSDSSSSSGSEGDEDWSPGAAAVPAGFLAPLPPEETEVQHQPQRQSPPESERSNSSAPRSPRAKDSTAWSGNRSDSSSGLRHPLEVNGPRIKTKYDVGTRIGRDLLFDARNHMHRKASGHGDVPNICLYGSTAGIRGWYNRLPQTVRDRVVAAGFGDFVLTLNKSAVDKAAIHALTERWWDTTHTFNLPCGEFTLSPLHFSAITGLRVGGQRIPFDLSLRERPEEVVRLLGFLPSGYANGRAPYDQLRKGATYRPCETEEQIDQYTRCFLLYMIGMSIFTINHDRTADMCFLSPLRDVDNISRFDWGGAALSTLYANLDGFSRGVRRGFGGLYRVLEKKNALLHLQIWAYELRLIKAPKVNPSDDDEAVGEYSTELPAGRRWIGKRFSAESSPKIHPHRLRLDSLEFHMINTNP
ncbi:protein MAINTENANCE OF MERISTEMS-like isoform X1 [Punica granatum]|uniref:Protein MAINTENANCE OF MERISTEMS-like isoform X1 n=1 Tax=Punica granatum TaxID=22663 RepID=A0A6P8CSE9_PUNGR|nr:protein MAINTENANCE OF MERISTEMS-like isoform X1 [Punica granatum]XP_031382732.1 protein MAINTENANCE OF MERISTEMS-like isoform X1 [Punica granatum]XP_031382733.1 protein MAINTENANCE OF MERISTEMS-like isoform X1 [Punica granatum]